MTNGLPKTLDGCYTRLLRYCLGFKWSDHVTNVELYGGLAKVIKGLLPGSEAAFAKELEARINLSSTYFYGIILISLGVLAAKELAQDRSMQSDFLI